MNKHTKCLERGSQPVRILVRCQHVHQMISIGIIVNIFIKLMVLSDYVQFTRQKSKQKMFTNMISSMRVNYFSTIAIRAIQI